MNYNISVTSYFDKQAKRLLKKYPSLRSELSELFSSLAHDPEQGTPIGHHCFKIRLAIASKGKGKSGGARVITYVQITQTSVYLLSIYDKSEKENIENEELRALLQYVIK